MQRERKKIKEGKTEVEEREKKERQRDSHVYRNKEKLSRKAVCGR